MDIERSGRNIDKLNLLSERALDIETLNCIVLWMV